MKLTEFPCIDGNPKSTDGQEFLCIAGNPKSAESQEFRCIEGNANNPNAYAWKLSYGCCSMGAWESFMDGKFLIFPSVNIWESIHCKLQFSAYLEEQKQNIPQRENGMLKSWIISYRLFRTIEEIGNFNFSSYYFVLFEHGCIFTRII
jgi:hypothetical protein